MIIRNRISIYSDIIRGHQKCPPVMTVPIANQLGMKVYNVPDWPPNISGMIRKDGKLGGESGIAIYVNKDHPETRRRFTIAHEIAHFVLHQDLIGDGITDDGLYRSNLSLTNETHANRFAADLLMPWHLVDREIKNGRDTVSELAGLFNVSMQAMSIRLGVPAD